MNKEKKKKLYIFLEHDGSIPKSKQPSAKENVLQRLAEGEKFIDESSIKTS